MEVFKILFNDKMTDISELKVTELKAELKKRGVSTTGTKRELYEKLKGYLIKTESQNNSTMNLTINSDYTSLNASNQSFSIPEKEVEEAPQIIIEKPIVKQENIEDDKINEIIIPPPPPPSSTFQPQPEVAINPIEEPKVEITLNNETNNNNNKSVSRSNSTEFESQSRSPSRSVSPSNGASKSKSPASNISIKSESVIKEIPMSGDRNRFSRSRSPKSRWHASPTPDPESVDLQVKVDQEIETPPPQPLAVNAEQTEIKAETVETVSNAKIEQDSTAPVTEDMPKVQRKRRWFTNDPLKSISTNNSVAISSDSLKTYLPEAKIPKTIDNDALITNPTVSSDENLNIRKVIKADQNDEKYVQRQPSRTVIIEENNELIYEDALSTSNDQNNKSMSEDNSQLVDNKSIDLKQKDYQHQTSEHVAGVTDEPERVGDVSPSREQESKIIHIKGLTRPFTLLQLKELLSKYGKIVDNKFWINNVKSHCLATYEKLEDAKLAREALHRTKWPQSNPKVLRVDFASEIDFVFYQNGEKPINEVKNEINKSQIGVNILNNSKKESKVTNSSSDLKSDQLASNNSNNNNDQKLSSNSSSSNNRERGERDKNVRVRESNRRVDEKPIREWDIPKLKRSRSRSRDISMERRRKNQSKHQEERGGNNKEENETKKDEQQIAAKEEEPPAKVLEDLFRKTNSTPCIYWLPLTDEEINEREQGRKQRMEEREKRRLLENEAKKKAELENSVKNDENKKEETESNIEKNKRSASKELNGTTNEKKEVQQNGHSSSDKKSRDDKQHSSKSSSSRNDDRNYSRSSNQQSSSRR